MPRSSLGDAVAIASVVCQITKRIIVPTSGLQHGGPSRPWPTQVYSDQRSQQASGTPHNEAPPHHAEAPLSNEWAVAENLRPHESALSSHATFPPSPSTSAADPVPPPRPPPQPKSRPWSTQLRAAQLAEAAQPPLAHSSVLEVPINASLSLGGAPSPLSSSSAYTAAASTSLDDRVSLPPQAPDGTHTEMKVVHKGANLEEPDLPSTSEDTDAPQTSSLPAFADQEKKAALLRQLDDSLEGYYGKGDEPAESLEAGAPSKPAAAETVRVEASAFEPGLKAGVGSAEGSIDGHGSPLSAHPHASESPFASPTAAAPAPPEADVEEYDAATEIRETPLRAAKVPSSRLGRLFHYGGLGAGLAVGAAGQLFRGSGSNASPDAAPSSIFMSEQNISRLVDKLSTMRGAALKMGQFLSIQDSKLLPPQIEKVLLRVQNSANYMPVWQMNKVMAFELGAADWKEKHFAQFDDIPFASASIGQVHSATLRDDFPDPEMAGKRVAVKVQFPGVLESIDSDLSYIRWLVSASALLPKGLFLDNSLKVMSRELRDECDYTREAEMGRKFRALLVDSAEFEVPKVVDSLSTQKVLVTEMMRGRPLTQAFRYTQEKRDQIAQSILNLALSELFRFRLMQTDPNWTNFLYNERNGKIQLIDFGATREYSKEFMDDWLKMLQAAIRGDHDECVEWSRKVGYLTGEESERMEKAHVDSMIALGEPFRAGSADPFPFESQTITERVKAQIPLMLKERLTPPPQETYSLNRKLSGAFLLCARLKAHVNCQQMFRRIEQEYRFGPEAAPSAVASVGKSAASFGEGRRSLHTSRIIREAYHALEKSGRETSTATAPGGGSTSLGSEVRKAVGSRDRASTRRRHGNNLDDRYPRSIFDAVAAAKFSGDATDTVITLSPSSGPGSFVETSSDPHEDGVDLERKVLPAEAPSSKAESPLTARADTLETAVPAQTPSPEGKPMGPTVIRGVTIPLKPPPPGPEECCMSGCAHCAYDIYAEDLEHFHTTLQSVRQKLASLQPGVTREEWREDLLGAFPSSASSGGGRPAEDLRQMAEQEVDRVIGDLDPTMKAFLEMERRMKKQERKKAEAIAPSSPAS